MASVGVVEKVKAELVRVVATITGAGYFTQLGTVPPRVYYNGESLDSVKDLAPVVLVSTNGATITARVSSREQKDIPFRVAALIRYNGLTEKLTLAERFESDLRDVLYDQWAAGRTNLAAYGITLIEFIVNGQPEIQIIQSDANQTNPAACDYVVIGFNVIGRVRHKYTIQ